jgi:hypothetical protein
MNHERRVVLKSLLEILSLLAFLLGSPVNLQRPPEPKLQPVTNGAATQTVRPVDPLVS